MRHLSPVKYSLALLILTLLACKSKKTPPTPEQVYNRFHSAVVMIKNEYVYKISIGDSVHFYLPYTSDYGEGELYANSKDAFEGRNQVSGTGFFIDDKGTIATNRHVVQGDVDFKDIAEYVKTKLQDMTQSITDSINDVNDSIQFYDFLTTNGGSGTLFSNTPLYDSNKTAFTQKRDTLTGELNLINNISGKDIKVEVYNYSIKILTDISDADDSTAWIECKPVIVSDDKDVDLALITTHNHKLPKGIKDFIPLDYTKDDEYDASYDSIITKPLRVNTRVYMIGYNDGDLIGKTSKGLKSQLTQGTTSQEPDDVKVLYSIPALPGSSGSPVFDEWGHLIAINFQGVYPSQGFNYGILAKHLRTLTASYGL